MTIVLNDTNNELLRKYRSDVIAWHGYVRFLGLPTYQNNPDIPIDELYVSQQVSDTYIAPDTDPNKWQTNDPVKELLKYRHLVVLGDPGCGKSTMVNWFAWYLSSGFHKKLPGKLNDLLPLPLVLRELSLHKVTDSDSLIDAFLKHSVARHLATESGKVLLNSLLKNDKVLLLVDGLDEVEFALRTKVRDAILDFIRKHEDCFILCTSRIVGFDQVPLCFKPSQSDKKDLFEENTTIGDALIELEKKSRMRADTSTLKNPKVVYIAPFRDIDISRFTKNWYRDQGGTEDQAQSLTGKFLSAIHAKNDTLILARTPNLLTMMTLLFRIRLRLPDGRALLYDDIAQAYLESIDTARQMKDPVPWKRKKQWLARVGFEMQLRRMKNEKPNSGLLTKTKDSTELLASQEDILLWLVEAMQENSDSLEESWEQYAEKYLDWIARRSGLLIPRGEGLFAFLHLSFQEYFSAVYIQSQVENPDFFDPEEDEESTLDSRACQKDLKEYSNYTCWHQTIIFLFELCGENKGIIKRLFKIFFPPDWANVLKTEYKRIRSLKAYEASDSLKGLFSKEQLLVDIVGNPHTGITEKQQNHYLDHLFQLTSDEIETFSSCRKFKAPLFGALYNNVRLNKKAILWFYRKKTGSLYLDQCKDISFLSDAPFLKRIELEGAELSDLSPLTNLTNLHTFYLTDTQISDISPLEKLINLKFLNLNDTKVSDVSPLKNLINLKDLYLWRSGVSDISPLKKLNKLQYLHLWRTGVSDVSPLKNLTGLQHLDLSGTEVRDVSPLKNLTGLQHLDLSGTGVRDVSPLKN
ncbi:MAG: NACHT domain-containing protein, partial [Desulfobacteraceae bacterium]|nr:NACHT domain-containing protein [Desulfobacteraceae bacterium]